MKQNKLGIIHKDLETTILGGKMPLVLIVKCH